MKKRLLFDWIALHATDISPRYVQLPALVVTNFAHTGLTFRNWAAMTAGKAPDPVPLDSFVQVAFANVLVEDFSEGGQLETSVYLFYDSRITRRNARCDGNEATGQPACALRQSERE
jgi:hypothetical protein